MSFRREVIKTKIKIITKFVFAPLFIATFFATGLKEPVNAQNSAVTFFESSSKTTIMVENQTEENLEYAYKTNVNNNYENSTTQTESTLPEENKQHRLLYNSLYKAFDDINNGTIGEKSLARNESACAEIKYKDNNIYLILLQDVALTKTIKLTTNLTIELSGYNIHFKNSNIGFEVTKNADVHITNCSDLSKILITGTGNNDAIAIYINSGGKATISCLKIQTSSQNGFSIGILNSSVTKINNCIIKTNSDNGVSNGISVKHYGETKIENCKITADSPYKENLDSYNCTGVENAGTTYIKNSIIKGVHSGIVNYGSLTINGGTYEGYGHGGFYFSNSNNIANINNATIKQWEYNGKYNLESKSSADSNKAGIYIGCGNDIIVHINNSNIYGEKYPIVFRDSGGELNNTVYITNSTINKDCQEGIRIKNDTHKLVIGENCNFGQLLHPSTE